jgi:hypothetical protein
MHGFSQDVRHLPCHASLKSTAELTHEDQAVASADLMIELLLRVHVHPEL